ncbi:MAG: hypothetical protein Q9160_000416 [Pyrenula sp. 1 TL-2023]
MFFLTSYRPQSHQGPLNPSVDSTPSLRQYSVSARNPPFPFRGPPNPTLDARWIALEKLNYLRLDDEDLRRSGNNPHAIRWPEEMGGGYMGSLEVVYHIHCLNLIRRSLFLYYPHYQHDPIFDDPVFSIEERLDGCIDILRQRLICAADSSPMAFYWIKGYPRPYPNFNTWHKCRDYDALQAWAEQQSVGAPPSWDALRRATAEADDEFDGPPRAADHPRPAV